MKTIFHGDEQEVEDTNLLNKDRMWHNFGNFEEGPGVYFAEDREDAKVYGPNIYKTKINMSLFYESRVETSKYRDDMIKVLSFLKERDNNLFGAFMDFGFEVQSNEELTESDIIYIYNENKHMELRNFQMFLIEYVGIESFIEAFDITGKIGNFNKNRGVFNIFNTEVEIEKD